MRHSKLNIAFDRMPVVAASLRATDAMRYGTVGDTRCTLSKLALSMHPQSQGLEGVHQVVLQDDQRPGLFRLAICIKQSLPILTLL